MSRLKSQRKPVDVQDIVALLGLLLIAAGLAMVSVAAACIVVGGILLLAAAWPHLAACMKED